MGEKWGIEASRQLKGLVTNQDERQERCFDLDGKMSTTKTCHTPQRRIQFRKTRKRRRMGLWGFLMWHLFYLISLMCILHMDEIQYILFFPPVSWQLKREWFSQWHQNSGGSSISFTSFTVVVCAWCHCAWVKVNGKHIL